MKKGYQVTLGLLSIMILLVVSVGTSYSYYSVSSAQSTTNNFGAACLSVQFTEGNDGSINLNNTAGHYAYPMTESTAKSKIKPYFHL